jgi:FkbM family methyltransferase
MLLSRAVGSQGRDDAWAGEPRRWSRGKLHGYEMDLDLGRSSERFSYFVGRFYEHATQLLLMALLRPGDRVADIGANVGEITLLCSRLVGPEGVVDAFEPNPRCAERIESAIARNRIGNIRLHRKGLASQEAELSLSVPSDNSGEGTLVGEGAFVRGGAAGADAGVRVETFRVPVGVGDTELAADPRPVNLIKIDVEGFEYDVLAGLSRILAEQKPLVTTEVAAEHLARAGKTPADLFESMGRLGYDGYRFVGRRKRRRYGLSQDPRRWSDRFDLNVERADPGNPPHDVLWAPREGASAQRVAALLGR